VYGDSVLLGAREELLADFAGRPVSVDAVEDRSLLGTVSILRDAGPTLGDVVVLDLGYNDGDDPTVFRGRIDDAMSALAGVRRVIWLNEREWRPGRAGLNAELAAATSRYPTLEVVDWNAEVAAHPDYVYADGIHLTPPGQIAMAALVKARVDAYEASLTPSTTAAPPTTVATSRAPSHAAAHRDRATSASDPGLDDRDVALLVAAGALAAGGAALALGPGRPRVSGRRRTRRAVRAARPGR
jgi:hypothetical protein